MRQERYKVTVIDHNRPGNSPVSQDYYISEEEFHSACKKAKSALLCSFPWEAYNLPKDRTVIYALIERRDGKFVAGKIYNQGYLPPMSEVESLKAKYEVLEISRA